MYLFHSARARGVFSAIDFYFVHTVCTKNTHGVYFLYTSCVFFKNTVSATRKRLRCVFSAFIVHQSDCRESDKLISYSEQKML